MIIKYKEILPKPLIKFNVIKYEDGKVKVFFNQDEYFNELRSNENLVDYYSMHYYDYFAGKSNVVSVRRRGSNTYFTKVNNEKYLVYQPLQSYHLEKPLWYIVSNANYLDEYYEIVNEQMQINNKYEDDKIIKNKIKIKERKD